MALEIKQEEQGSLKILTLVGRLDTETAPDFELAAHDLFEAGGRQFVADMGQISYVSSAGLRVLLALAKKVEGQGSLRLCALQPVVKEVFEKSGFARLFQIFPRIDAALAGIPGVDSSNIAARPQAGGNLAADVNRLMGGGSPAPAPAPAPASRPVQSQQQAKSSGGFWGWLKGLFGRK